MFVPLFFARSKNYHINLLVNLLFIVNLIKISFLFETKLYNDKFTRKFSLYFSLFDAKKIVSIIDNVFIILCKNLMCLDLLLITT